MDSIKFIAYKKVVEDIASGEKLTEYRERKEFYTKRFKKLATPFQLRLRGGYRKDTLFVDVVVDKLTVEKTTLNKWLGWLGLGKSFYVLHISKIIKFSC